MKKYNWKKAAAWICTLTLLTGTLSLSSFGEIGPERRFPRPSPGLWRRQRKP